MEYSFTYGFPLKIITDGGKHFDNRLLHEFSRILQHEHHFTTPYTASSNGMAERHIQEVEFILRKLVVSDRRAWDEKLKEIAFILNTSYQGPLQTTAPKI